MVAGEEKNKKNKKNKKEKSGNVTSGKGDILL